MTDCRVYSVCQLFHSFIGDTAEIEFGIFFKPFLCKLLKIHSSCLVPMTYLFFKEYCLSLQFLFNLTLCHIFVRFPGLVLWMLFTFNTITTRYFYFIRVIASFTNSCYIDSLLSIKSKCCCRVDSTVQSLYVVGLFRTVNQNLINFIF